MRLHDTDVGGGRSTVLSEARQIRRTVIGDVCLEPVVVHAATKSVLRREHLIDAKRWLMPLIPIGSRRKEVKRARLVRIWVELRDRAAGGVNAAGWNNVAWKRRIVIERIANHNGLS